MDLSQFLTTFLPGLLTGPYAVPITLAVVFLGPILAKRFPGLASILSLLGKSPSPSPLITPPAPSPEGGPKFPILDSLLSIFRKEGSIKSAADLPPSVLVRLREEIGGLIAKKAEAHAAELADLQGPPPEAAFPLGVAPRR